MVYDFFEELKDIIKEKIKELFIKIKYILLVVAFILLILCIFMCIKEDPKTIEAQQLKLFGITLENWAQWITIITIPYTTGWAIYQFRKSSIIKKQEKAAEIAKLFSEELLDKCSIIGAVIELSNMKPLLRLKEIDTSQLQRFDREEMIELYEDENIFEKYKEVLLSDNVQLIYFYILEYRISRNSFEKIKEKNIEEKEKEVIKILKEKYTEDEINSLRKKNLLFDEFKKYCLNNDMKKEIEKVYRKEYSDEEARNLFVLDNQNLPFRFTNLVAEVLNELEYICMYISSQSAGSYFVYQSLHQIFLRTIKSVALYLAYPNKNYSDKYYTNVIHVYKEWYNKREFDKRKEKKNKRTAYKYLEPKIKTV